MLQQHRHRAFRFQKRPDQLLADEFGGRNQHHRVGFSHDPGEIDLIAFAEAVLIEFPVSLLSGLIDALDHSIEVTRRKIRPNHADPGRNRTFNARIAVPCEIFSVSINSLATGRTSPGDSVFTSSRICEAA